MSLDQFAAWAENAGRRARGANPAPAFKRIELLLVRVTKENFDGGHAPDGTPWAPLKFARPRGGDKPLRDTGGLMASLTAQGPGHVSRMSDDEFVWGTNHEHAGVHQGGAVIHPDSARALSIPLTVEAARVDSPRNFPRPLTLVWKRGSNSGSLVEWKGRGKNRQMVRQFMLVSNAAIPARPFVGVNDEVTEGCQNILGEWFAGEVTQ
jgi:phage gpG-like protein